MCLIQWCKDQVCLIHWGWYLQILESCLSEGDIQKILLRKKNKKWPLFTMASTGAIID